MPQYRASQEVINKTVSKYVRASAIAFYNPLTGRPYVGVSEDIVQVNEDGSLSQTDENLQDQGVKGISFSFDPESDNETMNILDPSDGAVTGTMTYAEVYNAVYSLYFHLAAIRDAEQESEATPEE